MDETEALKHVRVMLKATRGVDSAPTLHKAMSEMLAVVDKALKKS